MVIAYGNPGRLDDGLGPAFAARLEGCGLDGVSVETDYQLVVEHAHEIARHDYVIFADSAMSGGAPFSFQEIPPSKNRMGFNGHSLTPEAVMFMARTMFGAKTKGYVLAIRGYEYEGFGEELSEQAKENLEASLRFILELLKRGNPKN